MCASECMGSVFNQVKRVCVCVCVCFLSSCACHGSSSSFNFFPKGVPDTHSQKSTFVFGLQLRDSELSRRPPYGYCMCRILAAVHKHGLLVILASSPLFAFLSAVASDVLGLVCMCEKQLPRDASSFFFFPQLSSSSHSLPTNFMVLCMNLAVFQTRQMFSSLMTFLWHFIELHEETKLGAHYSGNSLQLFVVHTCHRQTFARTVQ